jgi:hypothetical protein
MSRLDGVHLPRAYARRALQVIDQLWAKCSLEDRRILHPLGSFLLQEAVQLDELRRAPVAAVSKVSGFSQVHPVASALLKYEPGSGFVGLERLLCIAVAARLDSEDQVAKGKVAKLTENIRQATREAGSPLRLILTGGWSLPVMVRQVDQLMATEGARLHKDFAGAWTGWIRDRLYRWMHDDPDALRSTLRPRVLVQDLEGPQVSVGGSTSEDPEERVSVPVALTELPPTGHNVSPRILVAKAQARGLTRASQGDLCVPADQLAPAELVAGLVVSAKASAEDLLARREGRGAESRIALQLAIAGALRELDLASVVWGGPGSDHQVAIDLAVPVMYRTITRAPNAVRPAPELRDWLVQGVEQVHWPLPPTVHRLLKALAPPAGATPGSPVLPWLVGDLRQRYRLWDVVGEVAPELGLAPSQIRLAMATELAREFGEEVVQVLLGDTFSLSTGPAYYSATSAEAVAKAVAAIQGRWFGEQVPVASTDGLFGSRLILTGAAAQEWSAGLRKHLKSLSHSKASTVEFDLWEAHRNHLAAALSALAGARPGDWIGELKLDDVIPEYGLVLVSDKVMDDLRDPRVAATGRRWLADLRSYLDRLADISSGRLGKAPKTLAKAILRSKLPLFSICAPDGSVQKLDAATLRSTMPPKLRSVPNHTRHRLNQVLQAKGVSPELRHAQLGWVVSPAYTLADLSHWSARQMGAALAKTLDEAMVEDGWHPQSQRTPLWSWDRVPGRPMKDWDAVARKAAQRHQESIRRLREDLRVRWEEVTPAILERLAQAIAEYFPLLTLDIPAKALRFKLDSQKATAIELTADHHDLLCDRVRQGDQAPGDATEALATRILLYRLIRNARRKGVVSGPLPSRPVLSVTSDPSPFFKGLGLAVRQAESLRGALLARSEEQRAHDQGPITAGIVIGFSATRHLDKALAAVDAAASVRAPEGRPELVRLSASVGGRACPMVFSGLPALALAKCGVDSPKARAPSEAAFGEWCRRALTLPYQLPANNDEAARHIAALMRAAGRLELSGQERLVMLGEAPLAAVPVTRALARDDDWPVCNSASIADPEPEAGALYEPPADSAGDAPRSAKPRDAAADYARLTQALNPEIFNARRQKKSDGKWAWRAALAKHLEKIHSEVGETTNVGLLVGYARHRLRYGGRVKDNLAHLTLRNDVERFGSDLLAVAGEESLLGWEADEFNANYLATLLCKSAGSRRQAFDALITFHEYLQQAHQAPEIGVADLRAFAGQRAVQVDPGMATPREVRQVHGVLVADLEAEQALEDATPESVRLLTLREIAYLLLEASGIRPNSMHGLTLGDVFLLGPGRDFVRVRITGEFGQAKSKASQGYFSLEGSLWQVNRDKVIKRLAAERGLLTGRDWWKLPLFARAAGERRRFSQAHLTRRIDQLLKWSTGQRKADTYWLRKNRVTARHEAVLMAFTADKPDLAPNARTVYGAMHASGQASIVVPMTHYLSDPRVICGLDLHLGFSAPRSAILQVTGLQGSHLDMAWQRAGGPYEPERLRVVLNRLSVVTPIQPAEHRTDPPPLKRGRAITPQHLADYARAMAKFADRHEALMRSGLTDRQVNRLDNIARDLVRMKGVTPWAFEALRHPSAVLKIPRPMEGTGKLYSLLDSPPAAELLSLAEAWAKQGYTERLHENRVILELDTELEAAALRLLDATAIKLEIDRSAGQKVLSAPRGEAPSRSHAAGTRWVLSLVWIYSVVSNRSRSQPT